MSWLAAAVCARPRQITSACVLAALLGAAVVSRMPLRTDLLDALPSGNPEIAAFSDIFKQIGLACPKEPGYDWLATLSRPRAPQRTRSKSSAGPPAEATIH